jgi:multidrug resistance protein
MTDQNSSSQATSAAEHGHDAQSTDARAGKGARGSSPNSRLSNEKTAEEEDAISIAHSHTSTAPTVRSKQATNTTRPATLTRATSVTPDAIIIPRAHRRGLLARFTLIPEVQNPYHYSRPTKWFLTFIVAFCAMAAPMGSAIVMPVLREISIAFGASHTITNMSVAVYMLSMAMFPLFWSSLSERLGRRTIYIASFILFVIFAILSAVSQSISMLIVMRTLSGGAAASVQAVGAGTIADIWEVRERGKAMGIFYLGPLCGPLFAPIIGGALGAGLGWRSTQWFLVIYGSATLIFIIFALPETLAAKEKLISTEIQAGGKPDLARTSTRASTIAQTKTILTHLRQIFIDPLAIIAWLRFPPVALTVYYASITFGSLYILNISIQSTFAAPPYSFSTLIVGLVSLSSANLVSAICSFLGLVAFVHNQTVLFPTSANFLQLYIPNSIGYLLASIFGGRWLDTIMHREARKAGRYDACGKLILRPEDRMRENAWIAAILWPGALIWYGWTADKGVHWIVPMIANCNSTKSPAPIAILTQPQFSSA